MTDKIIRNNQVSLIGKVVSGFKFSHEVFGEGFYTFDMEVPRLSDAVDLIPVLISERLVDIDNSIEGEFVDVKGQFRSYNRQEGGRNRLLLTVFVREISMLEEEKISRNPNYIYLDGYICKDPVYRTTPFGREITDILLAVNRPYNKSDYIPCISWGRNARYADDFKIGQHIRVWGRIQSREYQKKFNEDNIITRVAYEVSISKIELVTEENEDCQEEYVD
ncbi:single-stranded DNA-binding protein [Natranaerovirga pectinivora]|uniref:Single-stranded DNA-binding protein n=1 Tax=Natranaerovirga pectinivora TaxID=682400 RepID=A0A4R3MQE2_9FIRM|nr:single-stranded DNA-binding protein [Natranaerovirga pectinivora]TCT14640.1 single-stranded DNA-binding protein [Natranaerovirga pectinivora]